MERLNLKNMLRVFSLLAVLSCLVSCTKTLSCDPLINEWANENYVYYESATREELVSLPMSRQRAIYIGLSAEKKVQLWKQKAQLVLSSGVLSHDEELAYMKLFDYIAPHHYDTKRGGEELSNFTTAWKEMVESKYNWDEVKLFYLTNIWMTEDEFLNAIILDNLYTKTDSVVGDMNSKTCECIYSVYCLKSGLGTICSTYPSCKLSAKSCGIAGNSNCTGTCQ